MLPVNLPSTIPNMQLDEKIWNTYEFPFLIAKSFWLHFIYLFFFETTYTIFTKEVFSKNYNEIPNYIHKYS